MKYIITLFTVFMFALANAQTYQEIKGLENDAADYAEEGVYYRDLNNVLDGFEGTYEYTGTDFYFKLKLEKKELNNNNNYWWTDLLKGTYKYIVNGVETNYLSDVLNTNNPARVQAYSIRKADDSGLPYFCPNCLNEKWLQGWVCDDVTNQCAKLFIAKRIVNGEEGLQLGLYLEIHRKYDWETDAPIKLPIGEFFAKKIN